MFLSIFLYNHDIKKSTKRLQSKLAIDAQSLNLAKFFVTSNVAIRALKNKYLRAALKCRMSRHTFTKNVLPGLMTFVNKEIELKLVAAHSVTLITDIWSSKTGLEIHSIELNQ